MESAVADRDSGATLSAATIIARFDAVRVNRLHLLVVAITALGFAFDLMEVALGNVLSAVFSQGGEAGDATRLSWLLAAMYIGAVFGAPAAGWLADRFGRRLVLAAVLAMLAVTSAGAAFSPDIETLIAFRLLSGLALGAYPPLIIAYLTDILPPRQRGVLIMVASAIAALGPVTMIFLVRWMTPIMPLGLEAWRWAFLIGAGGAALTTILFALLLPESPRWLVLRGRLHEALRNLKRLEAARPLRLRDGSAPAPVMAVQSATLAERKPFLPLALITFLNPWSSVALPVLMGAILIEKGFALSDTLLYVGISTFGPVAGTFLAASFLDRIDRRHAVALWAAGMLLSAAAFAWSINPIWLMASGVIFYVLASLQAPTLSIYSAECFSTSNRASATSLLWAINRLASAMGLLILVPVLKTLGIWPSVGVILGSLALMITAVLLFGPAGRNRQPLD